MGQQLSARIGRLTSREQANQRRETPEERRNNLIQQAVGQECKGLEGRLELVDLENIMRQRKPPKSLEELMKAACLKKLKDVRNVGSALADAVEPDAYKKAVDSVKEAGGYLPKKEEQKMKKEMKRMEGERESKETHDRSDRGLLIGGVIGRKCKGLDGELQVAEVRRIMESGAPARSKEELLKLACIQRLESMTGEARDKAIESVKAKGGFLPPYLEEHSINDIESARSNTQLLDQRKALTKTKK